MFPRSSRSDGTDYGEASRVSRPAWPQRGVDPGRRHAGAPSVTDPSSLTTPGRDRRSGHSHLDEPPHRRPEALLMVASRARGGACCPVALRRSGRRRATDAGRQVRRPAHRTAQRRQAALPPHGPQTNGPASIESRGRRCAPGCDFFRPKDGSSMRCREPGTDGPLSEIPADGVRKIRLWALFTPPQFLRAEQHRQRAAHRRHDRSHGGGAGGAAEYRPGAVIWARSDSWRSASSPVREAGPSATGSRGSPGAGEHDPSEPSPIRWELAGQW